MTETATPRQAQLDKAEREHLEAIVTEMRERVEANIEFLLTQNGLDDEPENIEDLDEDTRTLAEAIQLEMVDAHGWNDAFVQYVNGVGYTIVNRLAALRCMEVRDFVEEEVTVFKENGLTPAAETIVREEFLLEDEAILEAYHNACDDLAEEIEILFDRDSAYSQVDPDDDTFEELCGMLDEIPDEVWRADDVLGWVYEYYNRPVVKALDAKNSLEPGDVGPANQFYTPHWVVRMLTDNSLGKLYLEATDQADAIPEPEALSPEERKDRLVTPEDSPSVPELCTYLIPDEEPGDAPDFDHPRELSVIDPACGSGHFLLYAFDILERIWWEETDLDRAEIPAKVLKHNLYGVDIDLRSCQLSAFNLYLKARTRTEEEAGEFEMPRVGIVCAGARVAEVEEAADVLDEITGGGTDLRDAIDDVIETFQQTEALGSLLDVSGTLEDAFDASKTQSELTDYNEGAHQSLPSFLKALRGAVEERTSDSFGEQNLRSFLNLLVVLTQDYDTALMNPPYGSQNRIPKDVRNYLEDNYGYTAEFYINFFEACQRFVKPAGRTGMIIPRTFMFKKSLEDFREDFIGELGSFDFLAEFGNGILDNATVRTAGTVVKSGGNTSPKSTAEFIRLADVKKSKKEEKFLETAYMRNEGDVKRRYQRSLEEFSLIPGAPLSYWIPKRIRSLFDSETVLDADNARVEAESAGSVKAGLTTGNNRRFTRRAWEIIDQKFKPYAKGGKDAWLLPRIERKILWGESGKEIKRYGGSYPRNEEFYFEEVLTYTYIKEGGRRFGYLNPGSLFDHTGKIFSPDMDTWSILGYANTNLFTYFMIGQTPDRNWEVSQVSKVPYPTGIESQTKISELARNAVGHLIGERQHDITSPYYIGPVLIVATGEADYLDWHHEHPHRELRKEINPPRFQDPLGNQASIATLGKRSIEHLKRVRSNLSECSINMNEGIRTHLDISEDMGNEIETEIALRTNEDPKSVLESIEFNEDRIVEFIKETIHHLAVRAIQESDDGIIPVTDVDAKDGLLTHIEAEFERIWGEYADARLAEVDDALGSKSAAEEAYPNLREWLEQDLFDYHVSTFDRTPILWRFTTERLVSDPEGEGFGCLVDYHQLDEGLFDRLQNRYLEPRKNLLREQRSAANRRRSDDSLSASEQAEAAEEYGRCESGLEQIAVFEDRIAELAQPKPRQWLTEKQDNAGAATARVAEFRRRTEERLEIVDELAAMEEVDMAELFTVNFYEKVQNQRDEWIAALDDLEVAFDAYATDSDQPVEAHLYDLFDYYTDDLLGSSHFASNGLLYMTYYFDNFEEADQARLDDAGISRRQRLISQLASDLDEYIDLGKSISEDCKEISSAIPSDWSDRALSEITTAGYQPNHKHGVEINITPLAEAEIVPKTVDEQVL